MHICTDELNAIINSLPFIEHLACYARHGWRWLVSLASRRNK